MAASHATSFQCNFELYIDLYIMYHIYYIYVATLLYIYKNANYYIDTFE